MCGIYGSLNFFDNTVNSFNESALNKLIHRGPDESGQWKDKDIFFRYAPPQHY